MSSNSATRSLAVITVRLLVLSAAVVVAGCSSFASSSSPDVVYASDARQNRSLQIPPDLTDVSNAEQFVLPGTSNTAITRNTLLPQADDIRFVREGGQSWLEFQQSPEDLWPELLTFLRTEGYRVEQTQPVSGTIASEWRAQSNFGNSGILRNLVGGSEQLTRVAFRLERAGSGARLFARSQAISAADLESVTDADVSWPASSSNPENTSELLNRLLAFLGVEQQKAQGILDSAQAAAIFDDALIERNGGGSEAVIQYGFESSFKKIALALADLNYSLVSRDDGVGRIEFLDKSTNTPLVLQVSPVHISAVRVSVTEPDGARLEAEREFQLLSALVDEIA